MKYAPYRQKTMKVCFFPCINISEQTALPSHPPLLYWQISFLLSPCLVRYGTSQLEIWKTFKNKIIKNWNNITDLITQNNLILRYFLQVYTHKIHSQHINIDLKFALLLLETSNDPRSSSKALRLNTGQIQVKYCRNNRLWRK